MGESKDFDALCRVFGSHYKLSDGGNWILGSTVRVMYLATELCWLRCHLLEHLSIYTCQEQTRAWLNGLLELKKHLRKIQGNCIDTNPCKFSQILGYFCFLFLFVFRKFNVNLWFLKIKIFFPCLALLSCSNSFSLLTLNTFLFLPRLPFLTRMKNESVIETLGVGRPKIVNYRFPLTIFKPKISLQIYNFMFQILQFFQLFRFSWLR